MAALGLTFDNGPPASAAGGLAAAAAGPSTYTTIKPHSQSQSHSESTSESETSSVTGGAAGSDTDWSGAGETLVGSETEREEDKTKDEGGRRDKMGYTFRSIDEFPEFIDDPSSDPSSSSSQPPQKTRSVYANAQAQYNAHHPISSSSSHAQDSYGSYEYDLPSLNLGAETPLSEYSVDGSPSPGGFGLGLRPGRGWDRSMTGLSETGRILDETWGVTASGRPYGGGGGYGSCGLCFERAVQPRITLCCRKVFCLEHIADWLHSPSSSQRCPSCKSICTFTSLPSTSASPLSPRSPTSANGGRISPNSAYYVYQRRNSGGSGGAKSPFLYAPAPMKPPGAPGVVGLEVDEVFLRDDDDDDDAEKDIRRCYPYDHQAEGEDSSYKSTSPSLSRFGGSTGGNASSVESSQTRNSPPPPAHFEKTYASYGYPSSRNFGGPGSGAGAGSIRQRHSSSRLYADYHGFVEDYDYDHLTPPRGAKIRNMEEDGDTPSPPIRLSTFPASQAPPPSSSSASFTGKVPLRRTSSRALAHTQARGMPREDMMTMSGVLDMSGKVVSLVGLLVLFWVILS